MSNTDPTGLMPESTVSRGLQGIMPTYFDRQFGLGGPSISWRPSALEQAQTSYAVNARMHAAGQFALGFIPGYDLYRAATNPNANALDWTAGVLGVLPGLGKGAALGAKGFYAAVPLLGGAVREARAVETVAASGAIVIGKLDDLKNITAGERALLERLPNLGNPKANWVQNSSVLRREMSLGNPIRDATVDASDRLINNTGFLRAERNLLETHGWTFDSPSTLWMPPGP